MSRALPISKSIAVTTATDYEANDCIGGIITIPTVNGISGQGVELKSCQINDKSNNKALLDIYFFKSTPTGGTYTDSVTLVWGSGDSALKVGQIGTLAADWLSDISQCSANYSAIGQCMPVTGTSLFAIIVLNSGTPTFNNGDLTIDLEFDAR